MEGLYKSQLFVPNLANLASVTKQLFFFVTINSIFLFIISNILYCDKKLDYTNCIEIPAPPAEIAGTGPHRILSCHVSPQKNSVWIYFPVLNLLFKLST